MKFSLQEQALQSTLITAHRGLTCGNIPGNTLESFDAALVQGADMIELDVSNSKEGELFVFHPGMEYAFLGSDRRLYDMTADEIANLRFLNIDRTPTQYPLYKLDDALEHLKDRCYINIDKYWDNPERITHALKRHDMMDQVVIKSSYSDQVVKVLEELASDIPFIVITRDTDDCTDILKKKNIRYVGAEVLFSDENVPVASDEYIRKMNAENLIVWANSIVYNHKAVLAAGHNDDISIVGRMDEGWGWLLDKKFNIIQTDFPLSLRMYMNSRKK